MCVCVRPSLAPQAVLFLALVQSGKLYEWHKFNTVHAKGGAIRPTLLTSLSFSLSLSNPRRIHTLLSSKCLVPSFNVKLNNLSRDLT